MKRFLQLPPARRRLAFQQVDEKMGLQAASVEKDFWVCWTLRELFSMPNIGEHLTFKGGTSLSKGWGLIERFSEDIDLVIDKDALGFADEDAPALAPSKKQRRVRIDRLMAASRSWVQGELQAALKDRIAEEIGATEWSLTVDPLMPDGQCLLFRYPTVFPPAAAGYVNPIVKIELGARSDVWPHEKRLIRPYVLEQFPALDDDGGCSVQVLAAERTFWEKACLLHEETFRPIETKPRKLRMARHYYDLWRLIRAGVGERALEDQLLFQRVAEHREMFFRHSWVDYTTHRPGTFRLMPPDGHLDTWRADYRAMQGPMFYGETPDFEEMIAVVGAFADRFNQLATPNTSST